MSLPRSRNLRATGGWAAFLAAAAIVCNGGRALGRADEAPSKAAAPAPQAGVEIPAEEVARATSILEAYRKEGAAPVDRELHVVYFTPSDREPAKGWQERTPRIIDHVVDFFARETKRLGLGERKMRVARTADGVVKLHLVRGSGKTEEYQLPSGSRIRAESLPKLKEAGVDPEKCTLLFVCNLMHYDGKSIRHHSPYYGGGNFRAGSCWTCDSEILDSGRLQDREPLVQDAQYGKISIGKHNSFFIGGFAHELGHAFGLPHSRERADQKFLGKSLMGSGNQTYGDELRGEGKGSFLTLGDGLRIASHPLFSTVQKGLDAKKEITWSGLAADGDAEGLRITATVAGDPPPYAVVAYFDPAGGSDYDAIISSAVPDAAGKFTSTSGKLPKKVHGEVRLTALHANGDVSIARFPFETDADGAPKLAPLRERLAHRELAARIAAGDWASAERLAKRMGGAFPDSAAARDLPELVAALQKPAPAPGPTPSDAPAEAKELLLSRAKGESATVGWKRPSFDRVPDDAPALQSGGTLYASGIYAHAPAKHVWNLGGGWKKLVGSAGIQDGNGGSVVFEVLGDGRSLWKSKEIEGGSPPAAFDVDVSSVKQLELVVSDAGDGTGSDWGVWLAPKLVR